MSANLEHSLDLPARPAPGSQPSRRNLLIGLPAAAAAGTAAVVAGGRQAAPERQPLNWGHVPARAPPGWRDTGSRYMSPISGAAGAEGRPEAP
jgi:hypothetical protein